jgi:hypothetical protein
MISSKLDEISRDVKDLKKLETSRPRDRSSSHKHDSLRHIEDLSHQPADPRTRRSLGARKPKSSASSNAQAAEAGQKLAEAAERQRASSGQDASKQVFELPAIEEQPREAANETLNTAQFPPVGPGSLEKTSSDKRSSEAAKFVSSQTIKKVSVGTLGGPSSGQFGAPVNSLPLQDLSHLSAFRHSRLNTETNRENLLLWDQRQLRQ